jgi:hypothetical protein
VEYSERPPLEAVYKLLARLSAPWDPGEARLDEAMVVADALIELGDARSWASVWWSYGALHHDLGNEALARGAELLSRVDRPDSARAAALMLLAEIRETQAIWGDEEDDHHEERALLERAVALAPEWPALHLRLARACRDVGDAGAAARHATRALELHRPSTEPFDALTGHSLNRDYLVREVASLRDPSR